MGRWVLLRLLAFGDRSEVGNGWLMEGSRYINYGRSRGVEKSRRARLEGLGWLAVGFKLTGDSYSDLEL